MLSNMERCGAGKEAEAIDSFGVWHRFTPYSQFTKKISTSMLMVGLANGTRKEQEIHSNRHWKLNSLINRISKSSV